MSIILKAFSQGKETRTEFKRHIRDLTTAFDGYHLDYLDLNCELTTQEDFDDLISLLKYHKECFTAKRPAQPQIINTRKP